MEREDRGGKNTRRKEGMLKRKKESNTSKYDAFTALT